MDTWKLLKSRLSNESSLSGRKGFIAPVRRHYNNSYLTSAHPLVDKVPHYLPMEAWLRDKRNCERVFRFKWEPNPNGCSLIAVVGRLVKFKRVMYNRGTEPGLLKHHLGSRMRTCWTKKKGLGTIERRIVHRHPRHDQRQPRMSPRPGWYKRTFERGFSIINSEQPVAAFSSSESA